MGKHKNLAEEPSCHAVDPDSDERLLKGDLLMITTEYQSTSTISAGRLFPLGLRVDADAPRTSNGREEAQTPLGARFAVAVADAEVDLANFRYDVDRQIGVIDDGRDISPLFKHSTGKTRTNTAKKDSAPGDSDTDSTED